MRSCKPQNYTVLRFPIDPNPQPCQISQKNARVRLGDPLAPFVHNEDVADLKPPKTWDDSLVALDPSECGVGPGIFLILKCPASRDRCIKHERHQYLRPSSFADSISSMLTFRVRFRSSRILARALSTSSCRRFTSGTILAMARPCLVMMSVSPRSTSSSN